MAFTLPGFPKTFTQANGAVGDEWYLPYSDPNALIVSNKCRIDHSNATNGSRNRILARPAYECNANPEFTFSYVALSNASQFPGVHIKINTTLHKSIRVALVPASGGLVISKIDTLNGTPNNTPKGSVGSVSVVDGNTYVLKVSAIGNVYSAQLYESDGVTVRGTAAAFTDADGDAADFTGAWPCGISAQTQTDFDDITIRNVGSSYFVAAQLAGNADLGLHVNGNGLISQYALTRTSNTNSVSATVAGLPANVTNTGTSNPGTGNNGSVTVAAGASATPNATPVSWRIQLDDGAGNKYVLRPTMTIHAQGNGVNLANLVLGYTSTPFYAEQHGGLTALLSAVHAGTNAKTTTKIDDATYRLAVGGVGLDYWRPGSTQSTNGDLFNKAMTYSARNNVTEWYGPGMTSNDNNVFTNLRTNFEAFVDRALANGISLIFTNMQPRFDSDSELVSSTVSSINVAGDVIGINGYTFSGADVNRWVGVRHNTGGSNRGMYRQIISVDTIGNTATLSSAFTVFPATVGMAAKIWSGVRATTMAENNTEIAKYAHDSGHANARYNVTTGARVFFYNLINGVNWLIVLQDYLDWSDEIHTAPAVASEPGHVQTATMFRNLVAFHRLTWGGGSTTVTPDGDTITHPNTKQFAASAPSGYATFGWTVAYPGAMLATTWDVSSGSGSIDGAGLYTSGVSGGAVTVRARLSYALSIADTAALTVNGGVDNTGPTYSSASINTAGDTLTLNLTESGTPPCLPASGATGISLSGGHSLGAGTRTDNDTYTFPITPIVRQGETVTVSGSGGNITDSAGSPNGLQTFSAQAVTNNSTVPAPTSPTTMAAAIQASVAAWDVLVLAATPSLVGNVVLSSTSEAFILATDNRTALTRVLYSQDAAGVRVTRVERVFQPIFPNGVIAPASFRTALLAAIPNVNVLVEIAAGNFGRVEATGSVFTVYRPDNRTPMALLETRIENNLSFSVLGLQAL